MRKALKQLNGERRRFTGTFVRTGSKPGWKGRTLTTVLLKEIKDANGRLICDHLWFNLTKEFENLTLKEGVRVAFDARVKSYYKGYQGYREDVYDKPVKLNFKLSNPTKVQVVPYSAEYEAAVRKLQETAVWHLLKADGEHEVYCGENSANTIATDDFTIVDCPKCLECYNTKSSGFQDSDNPCIVKVGELIKQKAPIEEIVHAAKIAVEQKQINEVKQ